ncbi:hypothetical protein VR46_27795, partial [Streptomyces sp. NRRL S-444]
LHGYTYANQNPFTFWDPTGLALEECASGMYKCHNGNDPYAYGNRYETIVNSVGGTVSDDYLRYRHYGCVDFACKRGSSGSSSTSRPTPPKAPKPPKKPDFSWSNPVSEVFYGIFANAAHASSMFGWIADGDCWNGGAGAPGCDYGGDYEEWLQGQGIDTSSDWYQVPGFLGSMLAHREAGVGVGPKRLPPTNCFLAGTLVMMGDGSTKKIEDIEVGDEVLAADPRSGELGSRPVSRLIRAEGTRELNTLSIATSEGVEDLVTTRDHPFWSPSEQKWLHAGDLRAGSTLLTGDGETVIVTGNRASVEYVKTYNFTVDDFHTYYVMAGRVPILVHNTCEESAGIATLHYHGDGNHFSIEVTDGKTVSHTHLMPHGEEAIVGPYAGPPSIMSRDIDLPNASAALKFQNDTQGSWGKYHPLGNSCLTYCTSVLREGGAQAPEGKAAIPWARKFLSGQ